MKVISIVAFMALVSVVCAVAGVAAETITGKVVVVTAADPMNGIENSTLTVVDDMGGAVDIVVAPEALITKADQTAGSLADIAADCMVTVNYENAEDGSYQAQSIQIAE